MLIQQLLQKKILNKEKAVSLEFELKSSNKTEEELILEKKLCSEEFLFDLKSKNLKLPLKNVIVADIPLKTLEFIPEESARFYRMLPIAATGKVVDVGMVYPEDIKTQEALKFLSRQGKFSYRVFLITLSDYKALLRKYRSLRREVNRALEELETEMQTEKLEKKLSTPDEFERLVEEAPISKVVAVLLRHAVEGKASDIHIEPTKEKLRVRFRLLGSLHSSILLPIRIHPAVIARIKILSNLRIDESRIPQDGRFSTKVEERTIDFRVSTFPTTLGEKAAIRVLDPLMGLKSFEQLGMRGKNFEAIKTSIKKPYGMILSTGPTGSGKTTTLYAILRFLNKEAINIVTLEDPVEYFMEGVNQSQVKPEIGYDFAQGLRHILRQDPDVIMVGEIRDEETASLAIHAALTGHIVLSTLHTKNVFGVIPRLTDLGINPYLITPSLSCAIAQRLIRKLCKECKKKAVPSKEIKELLLKEYEDFPDFLKKENPLPKPFYIYQAQGCKKCGATGFEGQIGVFEVFSMSNELAEIIAQGISRAKLAQEFKRQKMTTMKQDGIIKVLTGETTIEEVLRVTEEK